MYIELNMTGRAVFVDASYLGGRNPLLQLRKATYRALLNGAETSEFVVVDEANFYMSDSLEWELCHPNRRTEYLPQRESEDVYLCCAVWCFECGVLLAVKDGRMMAACLPVPTIAQAEFLCGCRDNLHEMAAQAKGIFSPGNMLADTLRALAEKIDIDKTDKFLP